MWRQWIYEALANTVGVTTLVPLNRIYGPGALTGSPASRPFITIGFGPRVPSIRGDDIVVTESETVDVWAHDDQGSYKRIDQILDAVVVAVLLKAAPTLGYFAMQQGRSTDLADDVLDTLKKSETFLLTRRVT